MSGTDMKDRDSVWPGLLIAAFGAWQTYEASTISSRSLVPNDPVSSATLPLVLGVLTLLTGAALLARRSFRSRAATGTDAVAEESSVVPFRRSDAIRVGAAVIMSIVYALLLPYIGYIIATPLLVAALISLATTGRLRPIPTALVAVIVPTACYLLFGLLLRADIPALPM